jgi:hypothetical protein
MFFPVVVPFSVHLISCTVMLYLHKKPMYLSLVALGIWSYDWALFFLAAASIPDGVWNGGHPFLT